MVTMATAATKGENGSELFSARGEIKTEVTEIRWLMVLWCHPCTSLEEAGH